MTRRSQTKKKSVRTVNQPDFSVDRIHNLHLTFSQLNDLRWLKQKYRRLFAKQSPEEKKAFEQKLIFSLPHLFGYPWYAWAREFFETRNQLAFLTAANQVSKSSTMIRKFIHMATAKSEWPKWWKRVPAQMPFWYFYPDLETATQEFDNKWEPEFLPRGEFRENHPWYRWEAHYEKSRIHSLHFGTGVSIYFKSYMQKVKNLQAGTIYAIGLDEECPEDFWSELFFRVQAVDGYINSVFTATLNQEFWRQTMEESGKAERFKEAWKKQISLYDCRFYEDASPGAYHSEEKINRIISNCGSEAEVKRRVQGRFIRSIGRRYPSFNPEHHYIAIGQIKHTWSIYAAVDHGIGGDEGHPSAVVFLAVNPECTRGYVFTAWRGDEEITTAPDLLEKFLEMKGAHTITRRCYDYSAKDFGVIAARAGEPFENADKSVQKGVDIVNTLFRADMLMLNENDPEVRKLGNELLTVTNSQNKTKAKDDLADALRYVVQLVPWNFIEAVPELKAEQKRSQEKEERGRALTEEEAREWEMETRRLIAGANRKKGERDELGWDEATQEVEFWNEQFEGSPF